MEAQLCSICLQNLDTDTTIVVKEKGLQTLIKKSQEKNDDKWKLWINQKTYTFHVNCRKRYAVSSSKSITVTVSHPTLPQTSYIDVPMKNSENELQSSEKNFEFDKLCFICGQKWDRIHKSGFFVKDNNIRDRFLAVATERQDDLGASVIARLDGVESLVQLKARYHVKCYKNFFLQSSKMLPTSASENDSVFQKICNYIESSGDFKFPLSRLRAVIGDEIAQIDTRTLYKKLKQHYGADIFIFQHKGTESIIYYKFNDLAKICSDWYGSSQPLSDISKKTIITVCAEILRDDIKQFKYNTKIYPMPQKFLDNVVSDIPPILNIFLSSLLASTSSTEDEEHVENNALFVKRDNIAHSILSALRPKSFMSCLQLAVGTYIYRKTGSKLVINFLNKLGVCSSYHSTQLHEASSIVHPQKTIIYDAFVQFVFDNTDHNVSSLDGHQTFHCLGGIAVYTPDNNISYEGITTKCTRMPSSAKLASQNIIPDVPYDTKCISGLKKITFEATTTLNFGSKNSFMSSSYGTFLWGKCFKIPNLPMWRGFMETLSDDVEYSVSHIKCLPFINRPPSQNPTLNTALHYAASETRRRHQKTTFVTFDQPLYLKARNIVAQMEDGELKNVVIRLGGFHLLMSYLGAIGYIMGESGLEDLWSTVYASESVKKMLSGHAFSRAVRAHILTFTALGEMICKSIDNYEQYRECIELFLNEWNEKPPFMTDCESHQDMKRITDVFIKQLLKTEKNGPTAKLWIQYFRMVLIALQFIEAERLGNWKLHLQSIEKMLPIFHAAGHYPYAKCAQIYLQDMSKLEMYMDHEEYENYTRNGFFTIRRSHKAWAGVWSDMTIEQTLNRFFGTDLKHGRGVTPSVVARYLSAMPSAFNIMDNLENYCGITTSTSEQHVDLSTSRIKRDNEDLEKFCFWLEQQKPFLPRDVLVSFSTGIVGTSQIDCNFAFEKGKMGMMTMIGKDADTVTLSQLYKVKTLAAVRKGMFLNHNDFVAINPSLLFQRIAIVLKDNVDLTRIALGYELSPFPLSLFDENGYMRKSNKAELYKIFEPFIQSNAVLTSSIFVIDGGWLLHQVQWPHGKTFKNICELYLAYIKKHFSNSCVVFDGYSNEYMVVKSYERFRRREKNLAPDLKIHMDLMVSLNREKFLSNVANKKEFISLLHDFLNKSNILVKIAVGDADRLIVTTAIELNKNENKSVVVVGNDVDLLILITALTPETDIVYFYKMGSGKKENQLYSNLNNVRLKNFILFAHAFVGCDTTSALFNKGKKKIVTFLQKNLNCLELIKTFYNPGSNSEELYKISEKIILHLYENDDKFIEGTTISQLRYRLFASSVMQFNKEISLAVLPPTRSPLEEHTKRVYYQIQEWLGNTLNPEQWGWKRISGSVMYPIMNKSPPAPAELLEKVFCGCKSNCNTSRCTCKRSGIRCSQFCKSCRGQSCDNPSVENFENSTETGDYSEDESEVEHPEELNSDSESEDDNCFD